MKYGATSFFIRAEFNQLMPKPEGWVYSKPFYDSSSTLPTLGLLHWISKILLALLNIWVEMQSVGVKGKNIQ